MTSRYDFAPVGAVGASDAAAAAATPPLDQLRLHGQPHPCTVPARIYVCGITPYDVTHLGHAATFVWADVLGRVLCMIDVPSQTARNITDVDDVLTAAASGDYAAFGLRQEHHFEQDMRSLNVRTPAHQPRARHHIDHVIRLAWTLLSAGRAYERDGWVYFRGDSVPAEAAVTPDHAAALLVEYGDDPDDHRRESPFDVPLWMPSDLEHPAWPSPWGPGRPGWHVECAAMALASLGNAVDILIGGQDLAFPHHAYVAAMARAATGAPFTRSQFHVGEVRYAGAKMAKSTGNLVHVGDLLREVDGPTLRLLLLDRDFSDPWTFEHEQLPQCAERLAQLYRAAGTTSTTSSAADAVRAALLDDLDVPTALGVALDSGGEAARLLLRVLALD